MCKFNKPMIPADATADERRSLMFNALYSADLSEETEKKANLTYISWSQAWKVFKIFYPSATYKIFTNPNTGLPVFESEMGLMVHTSVQADGIEYEDWLPVMDYNNRAMKSVPYTIQVYDKQSKQYIEKRIEAATTICVSSCVKVSSHKAFLFRNRLMKEYPTNPIATHWNKDSCCHILTCLGKNNICTNFHA